MQNHAGRNPMGDLLLAILVAPLPLMLALTSYGLFASKRPVRANARVGFSVPQRRQARP